MTKFKIILPIILSLGLGGCEYLEKFRGAISTTAESVLAGGTSITATIANPVTRKQVAALQRSYIASQKLAIVIMKRPTCGVNENISLSNVCVERNVKIQIADYDLRVKSALKSLNKFVRNNDTVSAWSAYNDLTLAISGLKSATAQGVR